MGGDCACIALACKNLSAQLSQRGGGVTPWSLELLTKPPGVVATVLSTVARLTEAETLR